MHLWQIVEGDGVFESNASINHYYMRHADASGARVAPVGRAWARAMEDDPGLALHQPDKSHPTALGSYLAACVFYIALTGQSPVGLGSGGLDVAAQQRAMLQKVAWETHVARLPQTSPVIGVWPLAAARAGNDLVPEWNLVLGSISGPKGKTGGGTQFGPGGQFGRYATIPYTPGLNSKHITVAFYAHRDDWSAPVSDEQTLLARWVGFGIKQAGTTLSAHVHTVDEQAPAPISTDVAALASGWHHFALTYDGTTYALWIDHAMVQSATTSGDLRYYEWSGRQNPVYVATAYTLFSGVAVGTAAAPHIVGLDMYKSEPRFSGGLADIRIFDRALTAAELSKL